VREPPVDVPDAAVLTAVREHWSAEIDTVEHLPVGFGAHHWSASVRGRPVYFLTLDPFTGNGARHDAASLEAVYAAVCALMFPLDFVVAPVPAAGGRLTVPFGGGALSATAWVAGSNPERVDLAVVPEMLRRLHAVPPPATLPTWTTITPPSLPDDLTELVRSPWDAGPYGERARSAIRGRLDAIVEWSGTYHGLAELAQRKDWVVTHGEPGEHNLMVTADRTLLVDWETALLAPAERDWRTLVERGLPTDGLGWQLDRAMLEMYDLEWRLDEISQYAAWFAAPHTGTASDRVAMGGLLHELTRAPFTPVVGG
jgi:spectinomycin phosphotransferase